MNQPNQSELEQILTTKANYNKLINEDGSCVMCGIEPSALLDYITADRERVALEARIDALEYAKISPKFKIEERIEQLKLEMRKYE